METLIINIRMLVQAGDEITLKRGEEMSDIPVIRDAYLYCRDGIIEDYGNMKGMPENLRSLIMAKYRAPYDKDDVSIIDAAGKMVMPAFCDSHTHIVYAGSREREFEDKIRGLSYKEIAARGGGILNSALLLRDASFDELFDSAMERVREVVSMGTGAIEIKSGYGLTPESEIKMLRVIKKLKDSLPLPVKATFLGAHAVPARFAGNRNGYVDEIITTMIPQVAAEELADYIDVFCEEGFFSVMDSDRILNAGMKYGLQPKVHANQMSVSGGVQLGVKYGAASVDHLESISDEEINLLGGSSVIATLLPGSTFFLNMEYAPARRLIESGAAVALASNYNPGSCPSGSMQFTMALGCIKLGMTPEEVINAVTINGAFAMGIDRIAGSISRGKLANLIITKKIPSLAYVPYAFTTPFIDSVLLKGVKPN